jgi:hypothetical protein
MLYAWMLHAWAVQDLAEERTRDLERAATRYHLRAGQSGAAATTRPARRLEFVARPFWALGTASRSVADAATAAAIRLEGRSA